MKRTVLPLSHLFVMLLTLTVTLGAVAQSSPFKYVDDEALPTAMDGLQVISFNRSMLNMFPMKSLTSVAKKSTPIPVLDNLQPLLDKLESLNIYIAETPESIEKLQDAFAPMLIPGRHRSIKQLLTFNQPEDNLKVQIVSRESGIWCWRKCRELLIFVQEENECTVVGLTGAFVLKDIQELVSFGKN